MPASLKLVAIALVVACLLGACDSSTPTPSSSPAGSPAALVDALAPANDIQAAPSSGDPAPSASAATLSVMRRSVRHGSNHSCALHAKTSERFRALRPSYRAGTGR